MIGLRRRSSQAVLRLARLRLTLRMTLPLRLRIHLRVLRFLHNPPHQVEFHLALLRHARVVTLPLQSRRPVTKVVLLPFRDSTSARLTDLIYEVCPESRPLYDVRAPRCGFEAWFGQPEAAASRQRFRLYPRVAEVQEEVAARSEALARRAKPLSRVIPARARSYALADDTVFASSQPVNASFAQLAGTRAVGSRRWGSISFLGDGKVGAVIPESAGGDVFVPLADVWNTGHAEARQLSAFRPDPVQLSPVLCVRCLVSPGSYCCCRFWFYSGQASG